MNRALFLDRDGVINEDYGYVHKIEDFRFREGIFDVCRAAQKARYKIIVVTNQAGIGRAIYEYSDFARLSAYMYTILLGQGIRIDGLYHCPFHPVHGLGHYKKESYDRKPSPGMLVKACADHNINPRFSIMIGDKESDEAASLAVGVLCFVNSSKASWIDTAMQKICHEH
jgi:D-glycero-D-manno-heptose 1,7-bisphosphate phosphatase